MLDSDALRATNVQWPVMARGFESKQVESQQEEAARPKAPGRRLSPEEMQRLDRVRTLQLSRARLASDLQVARNAAHRQMLEQALAALDEQLQALEPPDPAP
jgi:hypothetical protein